MRVHPICLLAAGLVLYPQEPPEYTFGTTVAISSGLRGDIYLLESGVRELPNFKRLRAAGAIFATSIEVQPRHFSTGFPGITDRHEWFAIDYNGRFWVETPGRYRFRVLSDDGSKLYIDGALIVDNDGTHPPLTIAGSAELSRGIHQIRLSYFQGPRFDVALVLSVANPDSPGWRIFNTNEFHPPPDPNSWITGSIRNVKRGAN